MQALHGTWRDEVLRVRRAVFAQDMGVPVSEDGGDGRGPVTSGSAISDRRPLPSVSWSAGTHHDDSDFKLECINAYCNEPTGDRCVYYAILNDLERSCGMR